MSQTSFKQKLFLILFGFILTIVILEIGLRVAGGIVFYLQEKHNHLAGSQNHYRILCLGESTTALGGEDSYPSQLEKILNAQSKTKKFTVINKGVISTTSDQIVLHADQNLDMYKPDLVVIMMGINDHNLYSRLSKMPLWLGRIKLWIDEFKVVKLIKLLRRHIAHRIKELKSPDNSNLDNPKIDPDHDKEEFMLEFISAQYQLFRTHIYLAKDYENKHLLPQAQSEFKLAQNAQNLISAAYLDLARRYLEKGMFSETKTYLVKASEFDLNQIDLYQLWGDFYLAQKDAETALKYYENVIYLDRTNSQAFLGLAKANRLLGKKEAFLFYVSYLNNKPNDYWGFLEVAKWFREDKYYEQASIFLNRAIELEPSIELAYMDLEAMYEELGEFQKQEDLYLQLIQKYPTKGYFLEALGRFYQKRGKKDLAEEYLKKSAQMGVQEFTPWTWSNYDLLINKIQSRGIKVIVMQYPLRSISSFKTNLYRCKGLIFVENKANFKEAMQNKRFSDLFSDHFAYDFGHCTALGNRLIATNLSKTIQDYLSQ